MTVETAEILSDGSAVIDQPDTSTNQLRVRGVLIGVDDVSEGLSGKPTRWPAEVLQDAADREVFEGKPITIPDEHDLEQHINVQQTTAGPELTGSVPLHAKVGEIETTVYEAGEGLLFEGFVSDGYAEDLIQRGLAQVSPVMMRSLEEVSAEGTEYDELYEAQQIWSVRDVGILADGGMPSNKIEAMGANWGREALAQIFDEPAGSGAGDGEQTETTGAESPVDPSDTTDMGNEDPQLTDDERELLRTADRYDDPAIVETEDAEVLSQADELLAAANDVDGDVEVIAADELEALNSHIDTIDAELGKALKEQRGLREETVEAMGFEAKVSEFKTDDGELSLEALSQTPETGGSPEEPEEGFSLEALSSDQRQEIQSLSKRAQTFDSIEPDHAESLRQEAAEVAGAETFEELEDAEVV